MVSLNEKLNKIFPEISSEKFLKGKGISNEIAYYIFTYPPEKELLVRNHIKVLTQKFESEKKGKILVINALHLIKEYLEQRGLLDKAFATEKQKGSVQLLNALKAPLQINKLVASVRDKIDETVPSIIFITGIGAAYPAIRAHSLLNNLQPLTGHIPVVLFYPGEYDGMHLRLFNKLSSYNYYRAMKLIPD